MTREKEKTEENERRREDVTIAEKGEMVNGERCVNLAKMTCKH